MTTTHERLATLRMAAEHELVSLLRRADELEADTNGLSKSAARYRLLALRAEMLLALINAQGPVIESHQRDIDADLEAFGKTEGVHMKMARNEVLLESLEAAVRTLTGEE